MSGFLNSEYLLRHLLRHQLWSVASGLGYFCIDSDLERGCLVHCLQRILKHSGNAELRNFQLLRHVSICPLFLRDVPSGHHGFQVGSRC